VSTEAGGPPFYYARHVFCCVNEREPGDRRGCCKAKGSPALRDYMKTRVRQLKLKRTRINQPLCLDRCELGPTMVIYPEGVWYTYRTEADVGEILQTHLIEGGRVGRLLLEPHHRVPEDRVTEAVDD
jgi:(2Fe-2S) ferredoxin